MHTQYHYHALQKAHWKIIVSCCLIKTSRPTPQISERRLFEKVTAEKRFFLAKAAFPCWAKEASLSCLLVDALWKNANNVRLKFHSELIY